MIGGLVDALLGYHMGITADNIAEQYKISRQEQDEYALMSNMRACHAIKQGWFKDEIVPVEVKTKKGTVIFDTDEHPMANTSMEALAQLKPAFKKDGTVTAGNASGLNDAASAVVIMSRDKANEFGIKPLGKMLSWANGGVDPAYMGLGPIPAIRKALKKAGLTLDQVDVIELNEAFASQSLACIKELGVNMDKCNMFGGGVSLGHPIGCTGARLVTTAFYAMQRMDKRYALISMCIGGGMGLAAIFEREA
jgi:acetyl-CoA C-acetyltransferase